MSTVTDKPASKRGGDLTYRHPNANASRQSNEDKNPCSKEQKMSFQCLDNNGYDRDQCSKYFQNYRNCREFWRLVTIERKRKGVKPALPAPADRAQAKEDYKHIIPWK